MSEISGNSVHIPVSLVVSYCQFAFHMFILFSCDALVKLKLQTFTSRQYILKWRLTKSDSLVNEDVPLTSELSRFMSSSSMAPTHVPVVRY